VLFVEGAVTVTTDGGRTLSPLQPGIKPGKGSVIQTSSSSHASIALLPNIHLQLEPDTRLEIARIAMTKDGNETGDAMRGRYARVKLLSGRLVASHNWGEANAEFSIATSQGDLVARSNCLFTLQSDEHAVRLTCASGRVDFRPGNGAAVVAVAPGFIAEWAANSSSLTPAESEARGQKDLEEALAIEQNLRVLSARISHAPSALQQAKEQ
jgi:hypothetical protein